MLEEMSKEINAKKSRNQQHEKNKHFLKKEKIKQQFLE